MADQNHLNFLRECAQDSEDGSLKWNSWRKKENIQAIDLSGADLSGLTLYRYNLAGGNFAGANLSRTVLLESMFVLADLNGANCSDADLSMVLFTGSNLSGANFSRSKFYLTHIVQCDCHDALFVGADLSNSTIVASDFRLAKFTEAKLLTTVASGSSFVNADMRKCKLTGMNMTNADLTGADITGAYVYGVSVWDTITDQLIQKDLTISSDGDPNVLTVDDIEVAQFIYLISHSEKLSRAIDKITSKVVLILGRFTHERKQIS